MKETLGRLEQFWSFSDLPEKAVEDELIAFEAKYNVIIPDDFKSYFKTLNGTGSNWDDNMLTFYSLDEVKSIEEDLINYGGSPNYTNLSNTLECYQSCFVFADYSLNVYAYAIRLGKELSERNEVYVICGDEFRVVANSFRDFVNFYLNDFHSVIL